MAGKAWLLNVALPQEDPEAMVCRGMSGTWGERLGFTV